MHGKTEVSHSREMYTSTNNSYSFIEQLFFLYSYIFKDVLSISSNFLFHLIYLMIIIINDKYHIYATLIFYYASFANIFIL